MIKKAIQILRLKIGLLSNKEELLPKLPLKTEYESLLTDFHQVKEIEFSDNLDAYLKINDDEKILPKLKISSEEIVATGFFSELTKNTSDLRYSLFGNEGLLFRYALMLLEERYRIYSFHACSMYDEKNNRLFIGCGPAGSGKTCLIMKGLELGLKLFSTEMTHFEIGKEVKFYKGSLVDNIRIGNLKYSYPALLKKLNLRFPETRDEWGKKIAVNLGKFETSFDEISNCQVIIILPHIEEGREKVYLSEVKDERTIIKNLFDNASEKIGGEVLLYESIPVGGLDNPLSRRRRLDSIHLFLKKGKINRVVKVVAGSQNCWDGTLCDE